MSVINVKAMVGDARRTLQERSYKSADLILLSDEQGHLAGVVEMIKIPAVTAALESSVLSRVAKRLPWLMVGLALGSVATDAMSHFESVLEAIVTLALLIPAVIYIVYSGSHLHHRCGPHAN